MATCLGAALVYDDVAILLRDSRLIPPVDWIGLSTEGWWRAGLWRPVTMLGFGIQVSLTNGASPLLLHLVSLLLYAAISLALFELLRNQLSDLHASLIAAVLFAVHPVHVEVVAGVVGQAELLSGLFVILALLVWHRALQTGVTVGAILLLILLQLLAAGSKEQGYLLPGILLGSAVLLPRAQWRSASRLLVPTALAAVTGLAFVGGQKLAQSPQSAMPRCSSCATSWRACTRSSCTSCTTSATRTTTGPPGWNTSTGGCSTGRS